MNTGEIKQEIEKLFNNGYRLSEADEFFLITRLKVAQGRIQVEAWRRFSEALQLAITLWNLYLHQDLLSFDTNDSILDVALGAFEEVKKLEHEIETLGKQLDTVDSTVYVAHQ